MPKKKAVKKDRPMQAAQSVIHPPKEGTLPKKAAYAFYLKMDRVYRAALEPHAEEVDIFERMERVLFELFIYLHRQGEVYRKDILDRALGLSREEKKIADAKLAGLFMARHVQDYDEWEEEYEEE